LAALSLANHPNPALSSSASCATEATATRSQAGGERAGAIPGEPVRVPARRVAKSSVPQ
jgi:hypothetical protein